MNIHDFDMIRYVTGQEITEVYASGANLVSKELEGIDVDVSIINLKLSKGTLAVIKTTRKCAYGYDQRIEVLGEKGSVKIENIRTNTVTIDTVKGQKKAKLLHTFIQRYPQAYQNEINSFVDCTLNNKSIFVSIEDDIAALKVAQACEISYKENRVVKLKEIF
jgi:myo-inositol 2-dehydrogenase/D-chiro-inositol 1-dehydrogenase